MLQNAFFTSICTDLSKKPMKAKTVKKVCKRAVLMACNSDIFYCILTTFSGRMHLITF